MVIKKGMKVKQVSDDLRPIMPENYPEVDSIGEVIAVMGNNCFMVRWDENSGTEEPYEHWTGLDQVKVLD